MTNPATTTNPTASETEGLLRGRRPSAAQVLVGLFGLHVLIKAALFLHLGNAIRIGDEAYYLDAGRSLSNLLRDLVAGRSPDTVELQHNVVGNGWFMPGMGVALTPLFLVAPTASIALIRVWLGVMSTLTLLWAVISTRRVLGDRYAFGLLIFPGLVPMWLAFSFTAWGDLMAGLVVVPLVLRLVVMFRDLREGRPASLRDGLVVGLLAITAVYLRSSTSVVVVAVCAAFGIALLCLGRGRVLLRGLGAMSVAGVVFLGLLSPWSVFASQTFHDRVLTTTSVPNVMASTFGNSDEACFGPCDPGSSRWFAPVRYSREVARATGLSETEVQRQMSSYALRSDTPSRYARSVVADFGRYAADPGRFIRYLHPPEVTQSDDHSAVSVVVRDVTDGVVWAVFALLVALLLFPVRGPVDRQWLVLLLKLGVAALLMQPFVHIAGARYWTTLAPVGGLAVVAFVCWRGSAERTTDAAAPGSRVLTAVQVLLAAGVAVTALTLTFLAV